MLLKYFVPTKATSEIRYYYPTSHERHKLEVLIERYEFS